MYRPCKHKTSKDFMVETENERLWTCSNCGYQGKWSQTWSSWSNIECPECWMSDITWVACSDECAEKLKQGD